MNNNKNAVSKQTAGKIGLIGSISIIIASVVGVGIFFKNGGVFKNNQWNSAGVLTSWILAAIIALFTAFSYAEIVTIKGMRNPNAGLAGWSEYFVGYNFGRHVSITQSSFYYAPKIVAMGTYAAVSMFQMYFAAVGENKFHASLLGLNDNLTTVISMGVGIILIGGFMLANLLSNKFGDTVAKGATFIKFFPILMIIIIGLLFGIKMGSGMWQNSYIKQIIEEDGVQVIRWSDSGVFDIAGVFKSIPAILFAFDSFLVIGNVQSKVENPEKNVPLAIVVAMIIAGVAQVLITVGEITIGTGNPYLLLQSSIKSRIWYIVAVVIVSVSILIASLGVINSLSIAGTSATKTLIDQETIIGYKFGKKLELKHEKLGGFVLYSIYIVILWAILYIPSSILNTSQIYDGVSTLAVLFYFAIYGSVILGGLINRKTNKNQVHKVGYFVPFGMVAVFGCFFVFLYSIFYQFGIQVLTEPMLTTSNSFGFAMVREGYRQGLGFYNWQAALIFWFTAIAFIAYPFINDVVLIMRDRNYPHPLIWETRKKYKTYSLIVNKTKK